MATVQFIQYTPEQLQRLINIGIKRQLEDFPKNFTVKLCAKSCKLKKGKKIIEVISSIFQNLPVIIQIIDPPFLTHYHYKTIYDLVCLLCVFLNIYMKHRKPKPYKTKKTSSN